MQLRSQKASIYKETGDLEQSKEYQQKTRAIVLKELGQAKTGLMAPFVLTIFKTRGKEYSPLNFLKMLVENFQQYLQKAPESVF